MDVPYLDLHEYIQRLLNHEHECRNRLKRAIGPWIGLYSLIVFPDEQYETEDDREVSTVQLRMIGNMQQARIMQRIGRNLNEISNTLQTMVTWLETTPLIRSYTPHVCLVYPGEATQDQIHNMHFRLRQVWLGEQKVYVVPSGYSMTLKDVLYTRLQLQNRHSDERKIGRELHRADTVDERKKRRAYHFNKRTTKFAVAAADS